MCLGCTLLDQMPEELTGADFINAVAILCAGMLANTDQHKRMLFYPELAVQVEALIAQHVSSPKSH